MPNFDDSLWRINTTQSLAVNSAAGAQVSCAAFGSETFAILLGFPGSTSATGGCRFAVGSTGVSAASTQSAFLPANWLQAYKVTPGQTLAAISNDAGTFTLIVSELTK
jgi:hypothetical protein